MIGHPSFRRLRAFALAETTGRAHAATAKHLEGCPRCRARVRSIRDIVVAIRAPGARAPIGFDAIAARTAAGERVLLPVEAPRPATPRRRPLVAAAAAAVLIAGAIVIDVPEAGAEKSELWITPEAPRAGATLSLRYRATARLDDEERLVVRARYYTADRGAPPRIGVIGELLRTDGAWFEGDAMLPDSAVYAVLAVEDPDADFVDTNAERWQVLVHGDDGRPLFHALYARTGDVWARNTRRATEVARSMAVLYPERPAAWYLRYGVETLYIPRDAIDSVRAVFRPELERLARAARTAAAVEPDDLWDLIMLAGEMGETEVRDRWRDELIERYPTAPAALQQAAFRVSDRHRGDPEGYLAALDSIWQVAPEAAIQAAFTGWRTAQRVGRPDLMLQWAERLEAIAPDWAPGNGLTLVQNPETRGAGMDRLRAAIAELDGPGDERPLGSSAAEHRAARRRRAGRYLAALGHALLDAGRPRAALDTLDRALETGWNTELFRAVGDARLELGDTAGALRAFARLAADPTTSPAFTDSLRARLGAAAALSGAGWRSAVEAARDELRRELLGASLSRVPLRSRLRLEAPAGAPHEVRLDEGPITVVAFWSRYCPPSRRELDELDGIADRLAGHGVRFIGITDEADGAAVAAFFEAEGLTFPTYLDPERDARNAFDNRSTPYYAVLDANGRIRFTGHTAADIVRQVAVLGGPWEGLPQPWP